MPRLLITGGFDADDPVGPSLLAAARERLPRDWEPVLAPGLRPAWRALGASGAVVFAGGDRTLGLRPWLGSCLALTLAAHARGERVALLGARIEEPRDALGRTLTRTLAKRVDLLVVQDEGSARALVAAGVPAPLRVGADPAWVTLGGPPEQGSRDDRVTVAIGRGAQPRALEELAGIAIKEYAVALQPWETSPGEASSRCGRLAGRLGGSAELLSPLRDLADARRRFAGTRVVLAARAHALMAAAAARTPFVAVGRGGAPIDRARRLAQAVSADGDLREAGRHLLAGTAPDAAGVSAQVGAAEEEFRLLRLLVTDGDDGSMEIGGGTRLEPEPWL